jgi:hypothetical protein
MTAISAPTATARRWWTWPVLFVSFPLAGLAASLLFGPMNSVPIALAGGALVGLVLGFAQSLALGTRASQWVPATVVGLAVGTALALLFPVVGPVLQGLALGAAQAFVKPPLHPVIWVGIVTAAWTAAWAISWVVAISDEPGFVVFGASGALLFTLVMFVAKRISR